MQFDPIAAKPQTKKASVEALKTEFSNKLF
jgi:hypothetical protein